MTQENEGPKIVAICNKKGGVGKTTITQHLFYYLSEVKKKKVLAIDLDAQANLSYSLCKEEKPDVFNMIYGKRHIKNTLTKIFETGDLVCADENLDRINTLQDDMVKKSSILKNRFNSSMDFLKKYDFILLDCAPEFGVLTLNALFAANECLLVTNVDIFCFQAINSFQKRFMEIRKFNPTIKFNGIAVNRFCYYEKIQKEMMEKLRDEFKEELYNQDIRKSVEIIKAQAEGRTVFEGGKTNVSIDFKIFCEEFILRTQFVF